MSNEEEVKIFTSGRFPSVDEYAKHRSIADNLSWVILALEATNTDIGESAKKTKQLIDDKKALLWTVRDSQLFPHIVEACYVFPDESQDGLIPAIVANAEVTALTEKPITWANQLNIMVVNAIINTPTMYEAALGFSIWRLLDQEQFFQTLSSGSGKQRIVTIWEARKD